MEVLPFFRDADQVGNSFLRAGDPFVIRRVGERFEIGRGVAAEAGQDAINARYERNDGQDVGEGERLPALLLTKRSEEPDTHGCE